MEDTKYVAFSLIEFSLIPFPITGTRVFQADDRVSQMNRFLMTIESKGVFFSVEATIHVILAISIL